VRPGAKRDRTIVDQCRQAASAGTPARHSSVLPDDYEPSGGAQRREIRRSVDRFRYPVKIR